MRICDIITEGYAEDLIKTVQDLLASMKTEGVEETPTEDFRRVLAAQGYITTLDELVQAVEQSGFASFVDHETINITDTGEDMDEFGDEVDADFDSGEQVSDMAGNQALDDIKADL